ncbi:septation protein A [Litorivicinus lipolyticus]|uniref:septation protein A n=1 Tax=Litorivicinus lipolyticus TaxID=418701 RepID=UPI003B58F9CE
MKLLLDFLPIVLFFATYKWTGDLITATLVLIPATIAQVAFGYFKTRTLEPMPLVTLGLVVVLGGATVYLNDPIFIIWKPTLVNGLFAIAFVASEFVMGGIPVVKRLMGSAMTLPDALWIKLNRAWVLFFILSGATNLVVAYQFSEDTWVNFKLFGMLGLTLVFIVLQGVWMSRVAPESFNKD